MTNRPTNRPTVQLTSDGTPDGTRVLLNGQPLQHVRAVDLHVDADGVTCTVTLGQGPPAAAVDYGPAVVDVRDAPTTLRAAPTPPG